MPENKSNELAKYENELEIIETEIKNEINNLIYLLSNMNIKDINLLNFHFKFNDLFNKKDLIENKIFNLKINRND